MVSDNEITIITFNKSIFHNQKVPNACAGLFHRAENDSKQMENSFHRLILKQRWGFGNQLILNKTRPKYWLASGTLSFAPTEQLVRGSQVSHRVTAALNACLNYKPFLWHGCFSAAWIALRDSSLLIKIKSYSRQVHTHSTTSLAFPVESATS